MSRQSIAPSQRNLTLTEELEKLEQSITLTLQEIDHNFSRAHRIVTSSILPVVEEYATHSAAVWEGSKFWKQFFEASANVSLSSYEEQPGDETGAEDEEGEQTTTETETTSGMTPSSSSYASPSQNEESTTPERPITTHTEEDSTLSTPKPKANRAPKQPTFTSPYESLKRTLATGEDPSSTSTLPSTPRAQTAFPSHGETSSPLAAPPPSTAQRAARTPANDVLLHRVLDRNYRLQATPRTQPRLPKPGTASKGETPARSGAAHDTNDEEMDSSPFVEAPDLNAEIFDSPVRRRPRVPGVSVLTPARGKTDAAATRGKERDVWDSDSEDEGGLGEGISPPKTMQFHIPRERLLRTPAKEASKRIVEDLLLTAGGSVTDDLDEDSPSVVRRTDALDADTF
ncbi:MAG: hypothetical protein Q9191_000184 [Dirinaria sp. TL-2023a]